jgi:Dolichyl-phosphate-mannose-protein mannosyltransferase
MGASKNSASSLVFSWLALAGVVATLAGISAAAARWCLHRGYTLYFGDAEAHLNIARRILDSRTPGPEQIGTVWLPLPHLMMVPFVMHADWWRTGIAGTIPSCICFVLAGTFLFAAARRAYRSVSAGLAAALIFALNPNILYLQSTPMTEALFAAALAALVWSMVWFFDSQSILAVLIAAIASNAASLTRYEGWFLIPFASLIFLIKAKRKWHALLFAALAGLAPLAWLAHNRFYYGNLLEFYNGPWSAIAIYHRYLAQGMKPYPGDHDWPAALRYYFAATRLFAGWPAIVLGAIGIVCAVWRRAYWPLFMLALAPAFYVWSVHSSGTPIFVPNLFPASYYNTRYAMAMVPLIAFAVAAIVSFVPRRFRFPAALVIAALPLAAWGTGMPVVWRESEVNSIARREWTAQAAQFLKENYRPGSGILFPFGDLTGVLREAGIPLREGLHEGNGAAYLAAISRPEISLHEEWVIGFAGDEATTAALRADRKGRHYRLRKAIIVKGAPVVELYQLQ